MFWRGGGRRVAVGKDVVRRFICTADINQKRTRTNSFIFFLYGKKGGEEVDELVNERNRKCEHKIPHASPDHPAS